MQVETVPAIPDPEAEYTHEILVEMRKLGLARPESVSLESWAIALPAKAALAPMDMLAASVSEPGLTAQEAYERMVPAARARIAKVLADDEQPTKFALDAAKFVEEKVSGKATQTVEHKGSIAIDFRKMVALEEELAEFRAARDVGSATTESAIDKPKSTIDSFLEKRGLIGSVIGKRGDGEGEGSE